MLSAAKSFRLAFGRASKPVASATSLDRKPDAQRLSENQSSEAEREAALLYEKLRRVLAKPRFVRMTAAVRARVLDRLAKEENPESSYTSEQVRGDAQSTIESERSLTYCGDYGVSETDVDDLTLITLAASSAEAQPEDVDPALECQDIEGGEHTNPESQERDAVQQEQIGDGSGDAVLRNTDAMTCTVNSFPCVSRSDIETTSQHSTVLSSADADALAGSKPTTVDFSVEMDGFVNVDLLAVIAALRTVPCLEAYTDEKLVQVFQSESCEQKRFVRGDEMVLLENDTLVVVVNGTVNVWKQFSSDVDPEVLRSSFVRTLSAPAYLNAYNPDDRSSSEQGRVFLVPDSAVSCLWLSKRVITERFGDASTFREYYSSKSADEITSLSRHVRGFAQLLQHNDRDSSGYDEHEMEKFEENAIDGETVVRRVLRTVEDRLQGGGSVALFVINKREERMTRLRVTTGATAVTDGLPICGLAALASQARETIHVHEPCTDPRFDAMIDIATNESLVSVPVLIKPFVSTQVDPADIVLQFTTSCCPLTAQRSASDLRVIQSAAVLLYSLMASSRRTSSNTVSSASISDRFKISVGGLCVPLSVLPSVSGDSATLQARITMKLHHGNEELGPSTTITSTKVVVYGEDNTARFEFHENLVAPETCVLANLPLATRIVMEVAISSKTVTVSRMLRRHSSLFHSFSSPMSTTSAHHPTTASQSSASMSQSFAEAEECPASTDGSTTTTSKLGREAILSGWGGFFLYGLNDILRSGEFALKMWTKSKSSRVPLHQCGLENPDSLCVLQLALRVDDERVIFQPNQLTVLSTKTCAGLDDLTPCQGQLVDDRERLKYASLKNPVGDPFQQPTLTEHRQWSLRRSEPFDPTMLPGLLASLDWKNSRDVAEVYALLDSIQLLNPPELALRLLGPRFPDPRVRAYAVRCLETLEQPEDAGLYMLQLVHALQFERFHDSPLARFLLRSALAFPKTLGHQLYWLLMSDMHQPQLRERHAAMLDVYWTHTTEAERIELRHQQQVIKQLEQIHAKIAQYSSMEAKQGAMAEALRSADFPSEFVLPLDPSRRLSGLVVNECRVLGSKKKPLYLVFQASATAGAAPSTFHVLYKSGDDLRQDQLVLQLFRVMNRLWSRANLRGQTMQLISYGCVSTGPNCGMIEVVRDADTIASIFSMKAQRAHGSQRGSTQHKLHSALSVLTEQDALTEWLMLHSLPPHSLAQQKKFQRLHRASLCGQPIALQQLNPSVSRDVVIARLKDGNERDRLCYEDAVRNFATSCAASCVASYVLGIGDRHNDNIMVSRHGHLFHIDFGHILGNFKKKFGVKRERTMFVFTPAFAAVLMSEREESARRDGPQPAPHVRGDDTLDLDGVKKREATFLKHLKHVGHSKSCHLEPSVAVDDGRQINSVDNGDSTVSGTLRRQQWQRSIHASLRFSVSPPSRADPAAAAHETSRQPKRVPAYEVFTQLCCDGYNVVRHHADLLHDMCLLMTGGSLPELQHESDLEWLRTQLLLDETDEKASEHFLKLIKHSVVSRATLLNDAAHMLKHG